VPSVDVDVRTSISAEQVRAALIDFSERWAEIWPAWELYEVRSVGETTAEIKQGTRLAAAELWEVDRYDWSDPATVRWTVVESNFSAPGSFVSATIEPEGGGTLVRIHWERTGTTLLGRVFCRLIVATRGKPVRDSFRSAFRRLEAPRIASGAR
jgi:hypothetical protein